MSFGTTGGRGFEVPGAQYIWGAVLLVAAAIWLWLHLDLKRIRREESRDRQDEED